MSEQERFTAERLAAEHRRVGAAVTQLVADYVRSFHDIPICSSATPAELLALFEGPLPDEWADVEKLLHVIRRDVVAHAMNISSPRYFGLFNPAPLPVAVYEPSTRDTAMSSFVAQTFTHTVGAALQVLRIG